MIAGDSAIVKLGGVGAGCDELPLLPPPQLSANTTEAKQINVRVVEPVFDFQTSVQGFSLPRVIELKWRCSLVSRTVGKLRLH